MATIERREQSPGQVRYRVRWWSDETQRSKTFSEYDAARRFKAVLEGDMVNGSFYDPKSGQVTVAQFAAEWFPTVLDLRANSMANLRTAVFIHVVPEFGHLPLSAVTHEHVQRWVLSQSKRQSASGTRKQLFALRRICSAAMARGIIKVNPADHISLPSLPNTEQRFLTKSEVTLLSESIRPAYRAMILVAVYGGLRFGELCALRRSSVDPLRNTIRVKETLVDTGTLVAFGPPKTKTSVRTVTIPRSIMEELVKHMDTYTGSSPDSLVFCGTSGSEIRRAWFRCRVWLPALQKAHLEHLRFHDLRHTFVSLWVKLGRNAKEVSKVAGHSSVAFTLDRYGHLYDEDDAGLADSLDRLLA